MLPPLREVIARHGLTATKALGQNFLLDEQLLARIAAVAGDLADTEVLEIGPGPGGLTRALLRAGARVTAIERDPRCLPALAELDEAFPGQLRVIAGDALAIAPDSLFAGDYRIIANLPYNIGTALFTRWLADDASDRDDRGKAPWPPRWQSLTLMFQQEVAARIVAAPGTAAYGRLAVLAQWRSHPKLAMRLHRSAFTPPPKVASALIHLTPAPAPAGASAVMLARLTAAAFGQRRKMLRQSLKALPGALDALATLGLAPERRAETLSVAEFVALARVLSPADR